LLIAFSITAPCLFTIARRDAACFTPRLLLLPDVAIDMRRGCSAVVAIDAGFRRHLPPVHAATPNHMLLFAMPSPPDTR